MRPLISFFKIKRQSIKHYFGFGVIDDNNLPQLTINDLEGEKLVDETIQSYDTIDTTYCEIE